MMLLELALTAIISQSNIMKASLKLWFSSAIFWGWGGVGGVLQYPKVKTPEIRY